MELLPGWSIVWTLVAFERNKGFLLERDMNSAVAFTLSRMPLFKPLTTE